MGTERNTASMEFPSNQQSVSQHRNYGKCFAYMYLSFVTNCPSLCVLVCLSVCLCLSIFLHACLSHSCRLVSHLSFCLSVCLTANGRSVCLSFERPTCLLSVYLSIHLSLSLLVCLSMCLSVSRLLVGDVVCLSIERPACCLSSNFFNL